MMQVLSNNCRTFCNVISDITPEELCDIIRNQWSSYQLQKIPDDFIFNMQEASINKPHLEGYWERAFESSKDKKKYHLVDQYWYKI